MHKKKFPPSDILKTTVSFHMSGNKRIIQLKVENYDVAINLYSKNALVIIHDSIPGFGSIIYVDNQDGKPECDHLLGEENDFHDLLAIEFTKLLKISEITVILSFPPSRFQDCESIKSFLVNFANEYNAKV